MVFGEPIGKIMTDSNQTEFTDTHRRKLSVTMLLLDKTLCRYRRWAQGGYESSLLYSEQNDLLPQQREAIQNISENILKLISDIKSKFELEADAQSIRRNIIGSNAWLRTILLDLESKRMKGGGVVPPEIAEYLDDKIGTLAGLIDNMSNSIRQESSDP